MIWTSYTNNKPLMMPASWWFKNAFLTTSPMMQSETESGKPLGPMMIY